MRKILNITFLWTAGFILFAHSIIPHIHHEVVEAHTACENSEPEGIVDFLAKVFHNDLGGDHLEHFQVQKVQFSLSLITGNFLLNESWVPKMSYELPSTPIHCIQCIRIGDAVGLECMALRGPPIA